MFSSRKVQIFTLVVGRRLDRRRKCLDVFPSTIRIADQEYPFAR
jgi:hypothetical protein